MAGGVPAGRLNIDLVMQLAQLQTDVDKAKRMVKQMSKDIANDVRSANDNLASIGKGAKLAGHHTTNLAFQFQDLGIQMAAAAQSSHPLKMAFTAILQQGSQIGGIMMQAGIGVRGLITEIGGMIGRFAAAHPVLAAIAVVAGVVAAALKIVALSFDDGGGEAYARSLGLTNKEMKKMGDLGVTMGDVIKGLWKTIYDGLNLGAVFTRISDAAGKAFAAIKSGVAEAFGFALKWIENYIATVYAAFVGTGRAIASLATAAKQALSGDVQGALSTVKAIPAGYSSAFKQAHSVVDGFVTSAGKKLAKFGKDFRANTLDARNDRIRADAEKIKADRTPGSNSKAETLAREMKANEALIDGLYKVADAYAVSEAAGLKAEITAKATAAGIKKEADVQAYVAQQIRLTVAERTRDAAKDAATMGAQTAARAKLNDQVKAGLITSEQAAAQLQQEAQLRPYLIALDLAQGEAKTKLAAAIERLRKELKEANDEAERTRDRQRADQLREEITLIDREIKLTEQIGAARIAAYQNLRGEALRKELARINLEQQKALILERARAAAEVQRRTGQAQTADRTMEKARKEIEALEKGAKIEEAVRQAETARSRALETAHDIADVIGGRLGDAVNSILSALDRFDTLLSSANPVMRALGMAGLGGAAAKATGGSGLGGSIGGALGGGLLGKGGALNGVVSKGLEKIMGGLGQFAGPLGAIAGGILGGVIGGLFKKVKKGSQTIEIMAGEAVKTSLTGNSAKLKAAASKMADGLISGLLSIADQLGGDLGNGIKVSIGQRDKTFRVDLAGLGRTKNMPKFDTEAEAIQFAISEVIKQGAIIGLRAGTATLLKAEGDLEARLKNAIQFENVFKDLEQRANPAKAALADIAKEFDKLIGIFEEANATADDYAKLQELMAIKQREALTEAFEPIRSMLDDLKSKADSAADAVRTARDEVLSREADAIAAYEEAVARARQAQQQRWLDIVTTGYNEEIARLQSALDSVSNSIGALQDEASNLAQIAERLSDFSADIFGSSTVQRITAFSADAARAAAQAGDVDALQALKDVAISSATDRASMLRNLATLKAETDSAAGSFKNRASAVEAQIAAAEAQTAVLEQQIKGIEDQIEVAKAQAESLSEIAETVLSVNDALKAMQTATAAADQARATMDRLSELNQTEMTFSEAVAAYEAAKADRDDLIRQITQAGFADLIAVQQQTGSQMVAAFAQASAQAAKASSDAAAAIAAAQQAQAAAAVQAANDNYIQDLLGRIPYFAAGGLHGGGLRVVGENGPELEATGPARYYSNSQLGRMMGGPSAGDIGAAVRDELRPILYPMVKAMTKLDDRTRRWDGDGMPTERDVA